ncbi:MAG: hypothetical protein AAB965_03870 [Patescibacteria group bacterium]
MYISTDVIAGIAVVMSVFCPFLACWMIYEREYHRSLIVLSGTSVLWALLTGYHNLGALFLYSFGGMYFGTSALVHFRELPSSQETGWRHRWKYATAVLEWLLFLGSIWYLLSLILSFR